MAQLFVRERLQVAQGSGIPRFAVVAALGTDLRVFARHFRKAELEKLAEAAGAEIVYLPMGEHAGHNEHPEEGNEMKPHGGGGQGGGRGAGHRRGGREGMD